MCNNNKSCENDEGGGELYPAKKKERDFGIYEANSFFSSSYVVHSPDFIVGCLNKRAPFCTNKLFFLLNSRFFFFLVDPNPPDAILLPSFRLCIYDVGGAQTSQTGIVGVSTTATS